MLHDRFTQTKIKTCTSHCHCRSPRFNRMTFTTTHQQQQHHHHHHHHIKRLEGGCFYSQSSSSSSFCVCLLAAEQSRADGPVHITQLSSEDIKLTIKWWHQRRWLVGWFVGSLASRLFTTSTALSRLLIHLKTTTTKNQRRASSSSCCCCCCCFKKVHFILLFGSKSRTTRLLPSPPTSACPYDRPFVLLLMR